MRAVRRLEILEARYDPERMHVEELTPLECFVMHFLRRDI